MKIQLFMDVPVNTDPQSLSLTGWAFTAYSKPCMTLPNGFKRVSFWVNVPDELFPKTVPVSCSSVTVESENGPEATKEMVKEGEWA